jgi:organic radical activating enzyme
LRNLTITGGEPLIQLPALKELIRQLKLLDSTFRISIETNGTILIPSRLLLYCNFVVDYKLDRSEEMWEDNFKRLKHRHWVKFIIQSKDDFYHAKDVIETYWPNYSRSRITYQIPRIAMGPVTECSFPSHVDIIRWLIDNEMYDIFVNTQIHKLIGVE